MGKYIKLFDTHDEYETYITGSDKILPNVSYCKNINDVHYNPWTDPRVIAKFNVENVSESVLLYGADDDVIASDLFSNIEIDGEDINKSDLDDNNGYYTFKTTGEHTVKYTLSDPEVIGEQAFINCSSLTSITIPNSVTSIGDGVFSDCSSLTSITIPNGVTSIGTYAFNGCSSLTSITIPSGVTSIGDSAFQHCSGLTSISVENGNTVYDSRNNCNAIIETATNALICGCKNTIIPSSVTSIGSSAFNGCSGLTSINIPNSVTSIGDSALRGCSSLNSITSLRTTAPTIQTTTFQYVKTGGTLYVPIGSTGYNVWMGTGNFYLGKYNWTKVEQ